MIFSMCMIKMHCPVFLQVYDSMGPNYGPGIRGPPPNSMSPGGPGPQGMPPISM